MSLQVHEGLLDKHILVQEVKLGQFYGYRVGTSNFSKISKMLSELCHFEEETWSFSLLRSSTCISSGNSNVD